MECRTLSVENYVDLTRQQKIPYYDEDLQYATRLIKYYLWPEYEDEIRGK